MKLLINLILFALAALSILAGGPKILRMPHELEFLQGLGLSVGVIVMFGIVQVVGGLLILPAKTRLLGALLVAAGFLVSAVLVFLGGNPSLGLVSLVPTLLAVFAIQHAARATPDKSLKRAASGRDAGKGGAP